MSKYFKLERKLHDIYVNLKLAYQTNDIDRVEKCLKKKNKLEKKLFNIKKK